MTKVDEYRQLLKEQDDWEAYLLSESRLPGPRANLELAQAVAEDGDEALFNTLLENSHERAPVNTPSEFLAFCGVLGLGKLIAEGEHGLFSKLREYASDPRWRIREAVAMALQRIGAFDLELVLDEMDIWAIGNWLEKRAVAAGLAEPRLLVDDLQFSRVLRIFDKITSSIELATDRQGEDFKALRKGMGYCWSVVVASKPEMGKEAIERWFSNEDPDVRWIMKENLKKKRLSRMDLSWVELWLGEVTK